VFKVSGVSISNHGKKFEIVCFPLIFVAEFQQCLSTSIKHIS
jgi:hypothetical protein